MLFHKTNQIPVFKSIFFLAFSQLLFAQTYITINSVVSGNLASTNYGVAKYAILDPGRTYTLTAGGGDTRLYVYYPSGATSNNEDWGGMTDPKFAQVSFTGTAGTFVIYVYSSAGNFNFNLYLTDTSPCSGSCTSKLFLLSLHVYFQGCQTMTTQCSICPTGYSCSSCSGGLIPFGGDCVSACPGGYSGTSGTCACKDIFYDFFLNNRQ